jgi:hypothetical protein
MERITDNAARDLDETRRLLYMALVVGKTKKYNLAGTLINAIRHHQGVEDPALEEKVVAYVNGDGVNIDDTWIRGQIQRCIDALGD